MRSGMCLGDDLPRLHQLCPGSFNADAGEMEHSSEQTCQCDCHRPGTTLHGLVRGTGRQASGTPVGRL